MSFLESAFCLAVYERPHQTYNKIEKALLSMNAVIKSVSPLPRMLTLVGLLALVAAPYDFASAAEDAPRPNFLFLLADDLGWGDLGCQGHPYIKTPNIDQLAAEGIRFENFYVSGSVCHPSRVTFMTGQFLAHCFGDVHNLPDGRRINVSMAPGSVPVTKLLQDVGYTTAHIGKWHLNTDAFDNPAKYGLDVMHSGKRKQLGVFPAAMRERNGQDQKLARAAIQFMKEHREEPFYLQLWFTVPHSPVRPSESELDVYKDLKPSLDDFEGFTRGHFATRRHFEQQMQAWCAQITGHDAVVGEVLTALHDLGLEKNTIVFYSSDNGPAPPARTPETYTEEINAMGSAGPFRAQVHLLRRRYPRASDRPLAGPCACRSSGQGIGLGCGRLVADSVPTDRRSVGRLSAGWLRCSRSVEGNTEALRSRTRVGTYGGSHGHS